MPMPRSPAPAPAPKHAAAIPSLANARHPRKPVLEPSGQRQRAPSPAACPAATAAARSASPDRRHDIERGADAPHRAHAGPLVQAPLLQLQEHRALVVATPAAVEEEPDPPPPPPQAPRAPAGAPPAAVEEALAPLAAPEKNPAAEGPGAEEPVRPIHG